MTNDPMAAARNAVSNASRRPVADAEIWAALDSGDGAGHVVRALFGDCVADTLVALAQERGLTLFRLQAAYRLARAKHAAANDAMDVIVEGSFV